MSILENSDILSSIINYLPGESINRLKLISDNIGKTLHRTRKYEIWEKKANETYKNIVDYPKYYPTKLPIVEKIDWYKVTMALTFKIPKHSINRYMIPVAKLALSEDKQVIKLAVEIVKDKFRYMKYFLDSLIRFLIKNKRIEAIKMLIDLCRYLGYTKLNFPSLLRAAFNTASPRFFKDFIDVIEFKNIFEIVAQKIFEIVKMKKIPEKPAIKMAISLLNVRNSFINDMINYAIKMHYQNMLILLLDNYYNLADFNTIFDFAVSHGSDFIKIIYKYYDNPYKYCQFNYQKINENNISAYIDACQNFKPEKFLLDLLYYGTKNDLSPIMRVIYDKKPPENSTEIINECIEFGRVREFVSLINMGIIDPNTKYSEMEVSLYCLEELTYRNMLGTNIFIKASIGVHYSDAYFKYIKYKKYLDGNNLTKIDVRDIKEIIQGLSGLNFYRSLDIFLGKINNIDDDYYDDLRNHVIQNHYYDNTLKVLYKHISQKGSQALVKSFTKLLLANGNANILLQI
jgi:hypothetical protein